jgi:DNA polymerase-3 subunit alpha
MDIVQWLKEQKLVSQFLNDNVFRIEEKNYFIIEPSDKIISEDFTILCSQAELELIEQSEFPVERIAFYFGKNWYWTSLDGETKLNPLRYLGQVTDQLKPEPGLPFLGLHGKFELLNGSRDYQDWINKTKFLGYDSLAIVETQTLAGTMIFQETCVNNGVKPVIGHTAKIVQGQNQYYVKLLVKDKIGWRNLIKINKIQLVDNHSEKYLTEEDLVNHAQGLVCILMPDFPFIDWRVNKYSKTFNQDLYFQIDLTEWKGEQKDKAWLENINTYLKTYYKSKSVILKPLISQEAYYLDKIDAPLKKALNDIGKVSDQYLSEDQFFYSFEQQFEKTQSFFNQPEKIFTQSVENHLEINQKCNFQISTKNRYLPKYRMTAQEKEVFGDDTHHLFEFKILKGFEEKVFPKVQHDQELIDTYLTRIEEESEILRKGNVVDYFLILSDICEWCKENDILVGHGRGSAGGSLVSMLLGIIHIDPVEHDLLFSRFLTEGRLGIKHVDKNQYQEVEQLQYVEIETEDGQKIKYSKDSEFLIKRQGETLKVNFNDLLPGDEII